MNGVERSAIDFLVVCEELFTHMTEMKVDEEQKYAVESFCKVGRKTKVTRADHNMIIGKFNLKVIKKIVKSRTEVFKYNDEEGKTRFRELTSKNTLSKCFEEKDIIKASQKWMKELKNILHRSFKKVRTGNRKTKSSDIVENLKTKHKLKNELDDIKIELKDGNMSSINMKKKHDLKDRIEEVDEALANAVLEKNATVISEHF